MVEHPSQRTPLLVPEPVEVAPAAPAADEAGKGEAVQHPAKVMRIGSMIKQLLEEVRRAPLDDAGRERLTDIYQTSITELGESLSDDLSDELTRLSSPFDASGGPPSEAELRIAQAQLVGWLEGLFHGIQATLFAQQMELRQQMEEMRRRGLPPAPEGATRPGTYL
ncbi:MAG: bacterial proteasome activator family protein [Actinobacteria bacterium]|nr:bacterial proteasome activator family protein [Actinomycetota bacterium]